MTWSELANYLIPILKIALPAARQVLPVLLDAINEVERSYPRTDDYRETKRGAVFTRVVNALTPSPDKPVREISVGEIIAATQTAFTAIDAVHTIVKAQRASAAPAAAARP